jgi:6,7-dimethyl-8-ribityllumazine synthase
MPLIAKKLRKRQVRRHRLRGAGDPRATPHFDVVVNECAKGLAAVSIEHAMPLGFGVLTTENIEQAIERAGSKAGNKGVDAAMAMLETARVAAQI